MQAGAAIGGGFLRQVAVRLIIVRFRGGRRVYCRAALSRQKERALSVIGRPDPAALSLLAETSGEVGAVS